MLDLLIDFCREMLNHPRPERAPQAGSARMTERARRVLAQKAYDRRVRVAREDEHRRLAAATVQDALRRRALDRGR